MTTLQDLLVDADADVDVNVDVASSFSVVRYPVLSVDDVPVSDTLSEVIKVFVLLAVPEESCPVERLDTDGVTVSLFIIFFTFSVKFPGSEEFCPAEVLDSGIATAVLFSVLSPVLCKLTL